MIKSYIFTVFKKDYILFKKYKLQLVMSYLAVFFYLFAINNLSNAISNVESSTSSFESNPFLFLLTGYMVIDLTITIINILTSQINFYQTSGMFQEIISQDNIFLLIFSSFLFVFLLWFVRNILYLSVSLIFYDLNVDISYNFNYLIIFLISFILFVIFLFSISVLAASFTIIFKRGNPVIIGWTIITTIFSGCIYPINVLPLNMDEIVIHIPTYHFLEIFRHFMISTLSIDSETFYRIGYLFICSLLSFLFSLFILNKSIKYSKKTGKAYTY